MHKNDIEVCPDYWEPQQMWLVFGFKCFKMIIQFDVEIIGFTCITTFQNTS